MLDILGNQVFYIVKNTNMAFFQISQYGTEPQQEKCFTE